MRVEMRARHCPRTSSRTLFHAHFFGVTALFTDVCRMLCVQTNKTPSSGRETRLKEEARQVEAAWEQMRLQQQAQAEAEARREAEEAAAASARGGVRGLEDLDIPATDQWIFERD